MYRINSNHKMPYHVKTDINMSQKKIKKKGQEVSVEIQVNTLQRNVTKV